jgi:8-oxo-dGTP diphosphatase
VDTVWVRPPLADPAAVGRLRGPALVCLVTGKRSLEEVREEVGLAVFLLTEVWESETDDGLFRLHWWTADAGTDEVVPDPGEVGEFRWVTAEEFLTVDPVFDGDREFFGRVLPWL